MIQSLHRVEHKYIVSVADFEGIRAAIGGRLLPDENGRDGAYRVVSLYYDSPDHDFFWAKVDGQDQRRKVRLRLYPDGPAPRTTGESVGLSMLEVKQRTGRRVHKRRLALPLSEATALCEGRKPPGGLTAVEAEVAREVLGLARAMPLRPTAITDYRRRAVQGLGDEAGLRITFDTGIGCRVSNLDLGEPNAENEEIVAEGWGILEVKAACEVPVWVAELLRSSGAKRHRISKYCTGLALLLHPAALERALGAAAAKHECFRGGCGSFRPAQP